MHRPGPQDNHPEAVRRIGLAVADLLRRHPERFEPGVPLSSLTTLRIGGPALGLAWLRNSEDARRFLENARDAEIPAVCLGGGSNVLADDRGFCGLVGVMSDGTLEIRGDTVRAGAGIPFDELVVGSLRAGLTGLEFASGIPGSLGGALVGNAGCYGHEIGEFLREAVVLREDGCIETVGPEAFAFAYRHTAFKERRDLVLEAVLTLGRGDVAAALAERADHLASRRAKHPVDLPCAGSWFKNLPPAEPGGRRQPAGALLESVGAKRLRVGNAGVFAGHANIIVNLGCARSDDVLALAAAMRAAVQERYGIRLEAEVRHLAWLADPDRPGDPWAIRG
jgi:UDP-N-acetylmuramate dehydrogenase